MKKREFANLIVVAVVALLLETKTKVWFYFGRCRKSNNSPFQKSELYGISVLMLKVAYSYHNLMFLFTKECWTKMTIYCNLCDKNSLVLNCWH